MPEPQILIKNSQKWLNNYLQAREAYNQNPTKQNKKRKENAEKKYNHKQVRTALIIMFSHKCAYCESHVTHVDYPHIEHYKPKSLFPELCFSWENLLLGCSVCNGAEYKGDQFPENAIGSIINPVVEKNPEDFLVFQYDPETATANVLEKNPRGKLTKDLLGLNRPDLVRHRSKIVSKMAFIATKAKGGDNEAHAIITSCCNIDEEYSAFAKSLRKHFNL
jgi:uncharacterized protein (TIGR02646 family)